ncbi:MAG: glycoside hydrolase [Gammaproteobacteria bacterium]|nr:glycoside hydrolase [Gammaproteobacteria bacterium]
MSAEKKLPVALIWHMHQPDYRLQGMFFRPWVCLHALRGYNDMAAHLEAVEGARATVNFTPVLIDQIEDYAARLAGWREHRRAIGDALLDALAQPPAPGTQRDAAVAACERLHREVSDQRFPALAELRERERAGSLSDADFADLLVWYHLAWLGETLREVDPRSRALLEKHRGFDQADRHRLLQLIGEVVAGVLPRYRRLAESGRVELSMTPDQHPLMPLLIDFSSARDNAPDTALPEQPYPDGEARVRWHIQQGLARFQRSFGLRPRGCWPSEGALSERTLDLLGEAGFDWTASGGGVLAATLAAADRAPQPPHRLWRGRDGTPAIAFRDDSLSDQIGFVYRGWKQEDAVADLIAHCERIAEADDDGAMVLIALDGENPWEYYPDGGQSFVRGLYAGLAAHPRLRLATVGECAEHLPAAELPPLRAGSWVHGQLLTWIGHPQKNRAWELLIAAKQRFDAAPRDEAATRKLAVCEASDWFWWPGDPNPGGAIDDFDLLFRGHLRELYARIGEPTPELLDHPFSSGRPEDATADTHTGGTMRRSA